ncbi:MAG: hypothetical protein Q7S29_01075 [Candidatus Peribacter sp.]|nr:hypothetical protein [Candidatus Peribacter sp.]
MTSPGKDSPDRLVALPAVEFLCDDQGNETPTSIGFLVRPMESVNDSVRQTVGWSRSYAEGYNRIFHGREPSAN